MGHTGDKLRAYDVALCAINFRRLIDELWLSMRYHRQPIKMYFKLTFISVMFDQNTAYARIF